MPFPTTPVNGQFFELSTGLIYIYNATARTWTLSSGSRFGKTNPSSIVPPVPTDDSISGYGVGSLWINVSTDIYYICRDSTPSTAVWVPLGFNPAYFSGDIPSLTPIPKIPTIVPYVASSSYNINDTVGKMTVINAGTYNISASFFCEFSVVGKTFYPQLYVNNIIDPLNGAVVSVNNIATGTISSIATIYKTVTLPTSGFIEVRASTDDPLATYSSMISLVRVT